MNTIHLRERRKEKAGGRCENEGWWGRCDFNCERGWWVFGLHKCIFNEHLQCAESIFKKQKESEKPRPCNLITFWDRLNNSCDLHENFERKKKASGWKRRCEMGENQVQGWDYESLNQGRQRRLRREERDHMLSWSQFTNCSCNRSSSSCKLYFFCLWFSPSSSLLFSFP